MAKAIKTAVFKRSCIQQARTQNDARVELISDQPQFQAEPSDVDVCQGMLGKGLVLIAELKPKIQAVEHKSVTQQNLDAGEVEFF